MHARARVISFVSVRSAVIIVVTGLAIVSIHIGGYLSIAIQSVSQQRNNANSKVKGSMSAAICVIARDEEAYISEWIDYHLGLGFDQIYLYDNSYENELAEVLHRKTENVQVIHFPGDSQQMNAYNHCITNFAVVRNITWVAFFDVDEFLVLKKHDHVINFLHEYCKSGELGINWYIFGTSNHSAYTPYPVTMRFQYRQRKVNFHVKSIVKLEDMEIENPFINPHFVGLRPGYVHVDTNGNKISVPDGDLNPGWYNPDGPTDVAVFHHYLYKSRKEYRDKKIRGRADIGTFETKEAADQLAKTAESGEVFDDAAWQTLKRVCPKYKLYESIYS